MEFQWEKIVVFMLAGLCGGGASLSGHAYRCVNGHVRRSPRWFGVIAFANGIWLSLAAALATDRLDHSPQAILFAGIIVGAMTGMVGPDYVLLWMSTLIDVIQEAKRRLSRSQDRGTKDSTESKNESGS